MGFNSAFKGLIATVETVSHPFLS